MIEIKQTYEGTSSEFVTTVCCDVCYKTVIWGPISKAPKVYLAKLLLKKDGWSFGKVHKCNIHKGSK